jgi:hypothetical protein
LRKRRSVASFAACDVSLCRFELCVTPVKRIFRFMLGLFQKCRKKEIKKDRTAKGMVRRKEEFQDE